MEYEAFIYKLYAGVCIKNCLFFEIIQWKVSFPERTFARVFTDKYLNT